MLIQTPTGSADVGSGDYGQRYITESKIKDDDGFDVDDSDYDVFIEEVSSLTWFSQESANKCMDAGRSTVAFSCLFTLCTESATS